MKMRLFLAAFLLCLAANGVQAGAWPRSAGTGFISVTHRVGWPKDIDALTSPTKDWSGVYFEYGLTDRWTLGLDLGQSSSGGSKAVAFLQFPLRNGVSGPKVSVQLGFGNISDETVLRPGLAIGWGFENGWFTMESSAEVKVESGDADLKLDVTWGRNLARGRKLIMQVQSGVPAVADPYTTLESSIILPMRNRFSVEAGASVGVIGDDSFGLKLGFWKEF